VGWEESGLRSSYCKPGTFGSRGVERIIFRRDINETLAPARDPAVGIRVGPVVMDELGSPVGNVGSEAGGEGDEIFVSADVAPDAREAALGKAAPEKRSTVFGTIPRGGPKARSNLCSYSRVNRSKNW
jgi:hypothetical protein